MSLHTHNPLTGAADSELQVMARYYLDPNFTSVATEFSSLPILTPTLTPTREIPKANKTLKKLKRNERDRQCSFAKKNYMQQMRQQVKDLEECKERLIENIKAVSWQTLEYSVPFSSSSSSLITSRNLSPATCLKREKFVRLANEIQKIRHQNAVMSKQLQERDVIMSYMQNLLLDFSQDKTDSDNNSSKTSKDNNKMTQPIRSGPRPFNGNPHVRFTPLTRKEGLNVVRETLQLINNARLLYARDVDYHNRFTFLGWGQYTLRQGSSITFSVKKLLPNVTPAQLMATTWELLTNGKNIQKLIPSTVNTHIRPIQKLSDDLIVIDRRTEDTAQTGVLGKKLALRTVYVLFRIADADGSQTVAMKTINLPLVKKLLRDDECWCEIFYWMRFLPDGSIQPSGSHGDVATVTEFGGSNTYSRDEIAQAWLGELVFLAIRWESLVVAPTLLKF